MIAPVAVGDIPAVGKCLNDHLRAVHTAGKYLHPGNRTRRHLGSVFSILLFHRPVEHTDVADFQEVKVGVDIQDIALAVMEFLPNLVVEGDKGGAVPVGNAVELGRAVIALGDVAQGCNLVCHRAGFPFAMFSRARRTPSGAVPDLKAWSSCR